MDNEARILLDDTIAFCRRDGQEMRLINMLEQCQPKSLDDESLMLEAPSRFASSYLERQRALIERYLEEITFAPIQLRVSAPENENAPRPDPVSRRDSAKVEMTGAAEERESAPKPNPIPTATTVASAAPKDGAVKVKNTLSGEAFRRMMQQMKQESHPRPMEKTQAANDGRSEQAAPEQAANEYPAVDVNSKFTFETFVSGDENRHAYQSALRFAAFASEPGQCTSLFIYGNSGLGKTHLLFAIKNYLAAEEPQLRVKYANSGAYIDDYTRSVGVADIKREADRHGKSSSDGLIMRDYRDADILIIDDIQNVVGKTRSVEFFFQLVDEFIRNGKKIAIASDRAPKNLGLDERLTSRFNAGMLCLVSEPGFEMKYAILKNYYENTICGTQALTPAGEMPSLLSGMDLQEGHLSKEQLEHMAEISGNNIRELQGFCERCAGLSYEREQAGRELSAEDIDRIADEFFDTAHKVVRPATIMAVVEEFYHVSHDDLISKKRSKDIAFPRHVAAYLTNTMCDMSLKAVGTMLGRDHSTVISSIKVIMKKEKEDTRFREELEQLKNVILLKS